MTGENAGAFSTNNNKYIIGTVRNYGIYVLDVTNSTEPIFVGGMQTLGAEGIRRSVINDNLAYLYDGFKGVVLLNLSNLPEITFFSTISLSGWTNYITPILNEKYLIVKFQVIVRK